jgi:hypothetical protein
MAEKQNNSKPTLSDLFRYRENRMTSEERNAFERELQKDPFLEEALEGLAAISTDEANSDIMKLQSKLSASYKHKNSIIFYRIAASVAILMVISSVFIILERNRTTKELPNEENKISGVEIKESKPVANPPDVKLPTTIAKSEPAPGNKDKSDDRMIVTEVKRDKAAIKEEISAFRTDTGKIEKISEPERFMVAGEMAAPRNAGGISARSFVPQISGRVVSSDDLNPIQGVTIMVKGTEIGTVTDSDGNFRLASNQALNHKLVASFIGMESKEIMVRGDSTINITLNPSALALDEVVVVGYGVQKKSEITGAISDKINVQDKYASDQYLSAEPVNGLPALNKYIENNLVKPDIFKKGQRVVVVVNFKVKTDGTLDSFRIIKTGGQLYSEEAIRLIKEGPGWKPATENGKAVEEEVRVRIVFK